MSDERVIVDTAIWSLLLRRQPKDLSLPDRRAVLELRDLIGRGRVILLGLVRMELLSGIADSRQFDRIDDHLRDFDDVSPEVDDYVRAARFSSRCRRTGVAPSLADMLVCSMAAGRDLEILTADKDFAFYARTLPIQLHRASPGI